MNSAGKAPSSWTLCRTGPAPPEGLRAPKFHVVSATQAVVNITAQEAQRDCHSLQIVLQEHQRGPDSGEYSRFFDWFDLNNQAWCPCFLLVLILLSYPSVLSCPVVTLVTKRSHCKEIASGNTEDMNVWGEEGAKGGIQDSPIL